MTSGVRMCIRGKVGDDAGQFNDDDLDEIIEELEGRRTRQRAAGAPDEGAYGLQRDADRRSYDARLEAAVSKRYQLMHMHKKLEAKQRIAKFSLDRSTAGTGAKVKEKVTVKNGMTIVERLPGGMNDVRGLEAQIAYSNKRVDGGHISVEGQTHAYRNQFIGEMYKELKQAGLEKYLEARKILGVGFGAGVLDREIARELWELNTPNGRPGISKSPEARRIAGIVHKHMDRARIVMNRQGAWIRELTGYIATQSHDQMKLMRAGFEQWYADVMPGLDVARTFGEDMNPAQLRAAMQAAYATLSTGNYSADMPVGPVVDDLAPKKDLGINVAKKVSQHRVLHFIDADRWLDYNDKYGSGSLFTAVNNSMNRAARTAGLMSVLGPNPRRMLDDLREDLKRLNEGNFKVTFQLDKNSGQWLNTLMDVADGAVDQVVDPTWAAIGQNIRNWETGTGLGGALLSSLTTDPLSRANQLQYNGINALESMQAATIDLVAGQHDLAEDLAFGLDAMTNDISSRWHGSDSVSTMSTKATAVAMNTTLMPHWDNLGERATVATLGRNLWRQRGVRWDKLNKDLRGTLALYGFDEARWNVVRRFGALDKDAQNGVISASAMRHIPDSELLPLLNRRRATPQALDNLRDELEQMMRSYYATQLEYAMGRGGFRVKAVTTGGMKRGTALGELCRSVFLWKSYSLNYMQRVFGQFTETDSFIPTLGGLYAMPKSRIVQAAGLFGALTIGGYGSMVLKDISKGRTPRDPKDPNTWYAAMLQGGGLGIYGDFFFGEVSRYGTDPMVQVLGPVASDLSLLIKVGGAARKGELEGKDVYDLVKPNTPLINLFYARAAFDYLILYQIQEWLNPGSLRRMEQRIKKENNQEFLLPPSEVVR